MYWESCLFLSITSFYCFLSTLISSPSLSFMSSLFILHVFSILLISSSSSFYLFFSFVISIAISFIIHYIWPPLLMFFHLLFTNLVWIAFSLPICLLISLFLQNREYFFLCFEQRISCWFGSLFIPLPLFAFPSYLCLFVSWIEWSVDLTASSRLRIDYISQACFHWRVQLSS